MDTQSSGTTPCQTIPYLTRVRILQDFVNQKAKELDLEIDTTLNGDTLDGSAPLRHPFPAINPCARTDATYDAQIDTYKAAHKWGRVITTRLMKAAKHGFARFAPTCQCCAGMRIALLLTLSVALAAALITGA